MKSLLLAATAAIALGLCSISGASALPVDGAAIGQAAAADQLTQQARIIIVRHHHRHWRCWWHRGHRICRRWW